MTSFGGRMSGKWLTDLGLEEGMNGGEGVMMLDCAEDFLGPLSSSRQIAQ